MPSSLVHPKLEGMDKNEDQMAGHYHVVPSGGVDAAKGRFEGTNDDFQWMLEERSAANSGPFSQVPYCRCTSK